LAVKVNVKGIFMKKKQVCFFLLKFVFVKKVYCLGFRGLCLSVFKEKMVRIWSDFLSKLGLL